MERGCVEDQPQHVAAANAFGLFPLLRLVLRTQPRSKIIPADHGRWQIDTSARMGMLAHG